MTPLEKYICFLPTNHPRSILPLGYLVRIEIVYNINSVRAVVLTPQQCINRGCNPANTTLRLPLLLKLHHHHPPTQQRTPLPNPLKTMRIQRRPPRRPNRRCRPTYNPSLIRFYRISNLTLHPSLPLPSPAPQPQPSHQLPHIPHRMIRPIPPIHRHRMERVAQQRHTCVRVGRRFPREPVLEVDRVRVGGGGQGADEGAEGFGPGGAEGLEEGVALGVGGRDVEGGLVGGGSGPGDDDLDGVEGVGGGGGGED